MISTRATRRDNCSWPQILDQQMRALGNRQSPKVMVVACSDPFLDRYVLTCLDCEPASLLIRSPGPRMNSEHPESTWKAVEHAVLDLGIETLILCGQSHFSWGFESDVNEDQTRGSILSRTTWGQSRLALAKQAFAQEVDWLAKESGIGPRIESGHLRISPLFYLSECGTLLRYDIATRQYLLAVSPAMTG
ncbi:MAG: hypothetical protein KDA80_05285 [Planctomycetaceae bacterium]|nr:hypothetical protein [Planctomycetaceae bacterium]